MTMALEANALYVDFGKAPILWDLSFQIPAGHLVGIIGPNGAGKSTLLKAALGLISPLSGRIDVLGRPIGAVRDRVAYVPQREAIDWDFPITAEELVLMGRYGFLSPWGRVRRSDRHKAASALELVGMTPFAHSQIGQLSGGQQQRLFIARALAQEADLFLLDEPFSGVDLATEKSIMTLLKKQKEEGKSIFVVHHDLPTAEEYFDWALLLNTRLVACGPVSEVLNAQNLAKAFGRGQTLFDEATILSAKKRVGDL